MSSDLIPNFIIISGVRCEVLVVRYANPERPAVRAVADLGPRQVRISSFVPPHERLSALARLCAKSPRSLATPVQAHFVGAVD